MGNAVTAATEKVSVFFTRKTIFDRFQIYCIKKKEENVLWTPCIPEAITVILLMCYELLF